MKKKFLLLFSTWFLLPTYALAQDTQSTTKNSTSDFKYSGYVDSSYNYLMRSNKFVSGVNDRVYDLAENGVRLQQAAAILAYQPAEGFGALLNPILGKDTNSIAPYGWNPNHGSEFLDFDLTQAYVQYAKGSSTSMAGIFVTLVGAEVIDPTQDTNFSRSILDGYAEPFTVLGLRETYVVNDQLTLIAGINDGWDTIRDFGRRKTIELSGTYKFNSQFLLSMTGYSGEQRATDRVSTGPTGTRTLLDVVATYNATENLSFIVNGDYATQTKAALPNGDLARANWKGVAGYVNYKFNEKWRTSVRGEFFDDSQGYRTGIRQNWREVTLTAGYAPRKYCEFRAETRHDFSNVDAFVDKHGDATSKNQQSYALEAIYKF